MYVKQWCPLRETFNIPSSSSSSIKAYFLVLTTILYTRADSTIYSIRTHVQAVQLNPYNCTGGMTPSVQMYTPVDGSTRTAVQPASVQMYSCAAGPMRVAQLCEEIFSNFLGGARPAVPSWYRPSSGRNYWPIYARRQGGPTPPQ
jgi:hypothetical protein